MHPRSQAQARATLTVAQVQAVELVDCDWFFCSKGMLRVGRKCGLTINNGWREEWQNWYYMVEIRDLHANFLLNHDMDKFKTAGNQLHGYLKD